MKTAHKFVLVVTLMSPGVWAFGQTSNKVDPVPEAKVGDQIVFPETSRVVILTGTDIDKVTETPQTFPQMNTHIPSKEVSKGQAALIIGKRTQSSSRLFFDKIDTLELALQNCTANCNVRISVAHFSALGRKNYGRAYGIGGLSTIEAHGSEIQSVARETKAEIESVTNVSQNIQTVLPSTGYYADLQNQDDEAIATRRAQLRNMLPAAVGAPPVGEH